MAARIAGRAAEASRQATVTRRTGRGSSATARTEAGSAGHAKRGMTAMPSPDAMSVSWVSNSPTWKSGRTPGRTRTSHSWQMSPALVEIHRSSRASASVVVSPQGCPSAVLGERVGTTDVVGGVLVVGGILLGLVRSGPARSRPAAVSQPSDAPDGLDKVAA
jgi:hypothetical protein